MSRNKIALAFIVLSGGALFSLTRFNAPQTIIPSSIPPAPMEDGVVLLGVRPLEVVPVTYPVDLDFGKGKLALFEFTLPTGSGPFRIEALAARLRGTSDDEVPELWLRFNSVRVYSKASVSGSAALFSAFPPILTPDNLPPDSLPDTPTIYLQNPQETQLLVLPPGAFPQELPAGAIVSVGIYAKWFPDIARREPKNGFRLCLDRISGTFTDSGVRAATSFASPLCWERMGISHSDPSAQIPPKPYISLLAAEGGVNIPVELAETDAQRVKGLADRDTLDANRGMLFFWEDEDVFVPFTMAGMRFGLDILFIEEENGKFFVQKIEENLPPCPDRNNCALAHPSGPYRYVVELNAGFSEQYGIRQKDSANIVRSP